MGSYIGIDLGTSAVKLLLLRENGDVLGTAEERYPVSYPRVGWAEQNPQAWYTAAVRGIRQLLAGHRADEVRGIGIAGQMHGLVLLNRHGAVLRPAILWNDGRSAAETERLNREIGEKRLLELTVSASYDSPVEKVTAALREVAEAAPGRLPEEAVVVAVNRYDASDINYMLRLWVDSPRFFEAKLYVTEQIKTAFDRRGIEMSYPHLNVHLDR